MKFISKYFISVILVITIINICFCLNMDRKNNKNEVKISTPNIIKRCSGYSEKVLKQDEIEASNYLIFFFILSYFYTNYL